MIELKDKYNRVHNYLRISLTDKCNLNCFYCNPIGGIVNRSHNEIMTYEEIAKIVEIFVSVFGFNKIRLTGGEPFARKHIENLIQLLKNVKNNYPFELSATSNGTIINDRLKQLWLSGLDRINFSLDSLDSEKFKSITGKDELLNVLNAIETASKSGYNDIKINTVIIKGINDNELIDFVDYIANTKWNIRFIEYMPFSNNDYNSDRLVTVDEMQECISSKYKLIHLPNENSVAKDFAIEGFSGKVSFISSISNHFCDSCNRLRLTSIGELKLCLFSKKGTELNLRDALRAGKTDAEIINDVIEFINQKEMNHPDLDELISLKNNEMISIGG